MIKSIKLKLWLTFFITFVACLGSFLILTHMSVKQRFLDYATNQILERLEPLEQAVTDVYNESQSLSPFVDTTSRWTQLRDATYRQYLQHQRQRRPLEPKADNWDLQQTLDKKTQANQRSFFQHLVLADTAKQLIAGRRQEKANYVYRPVMSGDSLIAYIGYIKPKAFLRSVDKLFVDEQLRSFTIISIATFFVSLVATLFVSRWLVTPISKLSRGARQLAKGNFSVRIASTSTDELGQLCDNFDEMAHTLKMNEQARKQWVADISHELRTPLSVLTAQIEAMQDGIRATSPENIALLKKSTDNLSYIVGDLYELSLADIGALSYNKDTFDLAILLRDVINAYQDKFDAKSLTLTFQQQPSDALIFADQKRIRQLIINLVENSLRYTDAGGEVSVHLSQQANRKGQTYTRINIEDSAPNVPESAHIRLFDRLYRVESSRNRETGGAGLGLSICKKIVEGHSGEIHASHSVLGGLSMTITLPTKNL